MADKYTKVKPKVHPLTISAIVGFFVLVIALIIVLQPTNKDLVYSQYSQFASNDLTKDHPFYEVNYKSTLFSKGLKKVIENEDIVFVYIGSPGCESCQAHIGAFQKYYDQLELNAYIKTIYYLNPSTDLTQFEEFMADFEDVKGETPQLIVFKNGEILDQFEVADETVSPHLTAEQRINASVRKFYERVIVSLDK